MLELFAQQLNAVYSVTSKPLITFPLGVEHSYLMALELRRAQQGLTAQVKKYGVDKDMLELAEFYQNVYEELVELSNE
jgi:hypothetical protein